MGPGNRAQVNMTFKAKFIGIPSEPETESLTMFGIEFPKGKAVVVPYPTHAARKLSANPFFETKGDDVTDVTPKDDKAQEQELQTLAAAAIEAEQNNATEEAAAHGNAPATGEANAAKTGRRRGAGSAEFG